MVPQTRKIPSLYIALHPNAQEYGRGKADKEALEHLERAAWE
jgi:hypothetical protein